jgi:hypothetical protein
MTDNTQHQDRRGGSAGGVKAPHTEGSDDSQEHSTAGGGLPGLPRLQKYDCKQHYHGERLSCTARENSPSTGWRGVYAAMEVPADG